MIASLIKEAQPRNSKCFDFGLTSGTVAKNQAQLREIVRENLTEEQATFLSQGFFSFDGSLRLSEEAFAQFAPNYFKKSRRVVSHRGQIHLRGSRYSISANPTFELRSKLKNLREDFDEGIDVLAEVRHPLFQLAIADYIKNSTISMFNAFLHEEKTGKYRLTVLSYQNLRRDGQNLCQASVNLFYGMMFRSPEQVRAADRALRAGRKTFYKLQEYILSKYSHGVFSSRHVTRAEISHPLIISAAASQLVFNKKIVPDVIIGIPSGSTELAMAHRFGYAFAQNGSPRVLLFPVSFHSSKQEIDGEIDVTAFTRWVHHHRASLENAKVVICDDNSSTGRTIQAIADAIAPASPSLIEIAVAEADIIRSRIDLNSPDRRCIADPEIYQNSVGVLPVSTGLCVKADLRELYEQRKIIRCIETRYLQIGSDISRRICGEVYASMVRERGRNQPSLIIETDIIDRFKGTELSNFFPAKVWLKGERFESVEHAYQAMKFPADTWSRLTSVDVENINRRIVQYGYVVSKDNLPNLFNNRAAPAGASKKAANFLQHRGFVRSDWDEIKVGIMIDLLIQKFSQIDLYEVLSQTRDRMLIEGNDWNDTFWGVSGGRGRNVLGRILMAIRNESRSDLAHAAAEIRKRII